MNQWELIPGFPGYEVSPEGVVRNRTTRRPLKPQENQMGLVFIGMLDEDGVQRQRGLAHLVAETFIPQDLDSFDTPINVNGNRWDCSVGNLMWRPRWFAINYHMQFKRRYAYPIDAPLRDARTGKIYRDSWAVTIAFGLLEKELVVSVELRTYVWPTYQIFEIVE